MSLTDTFHQLYFKSTGHSFTNLGRMFLRLFVGWMLAQFGIRQLMEGGSQLSGMVFPFIEYGLALWLVIIVELVCSFFIMIGLFMRLMIIPPFILMVCTAHELVFGAAAGGASLSLLAFPFLFMGIFFFLLLVGPGKISVDYFYSLYLISRDHNGKEDDLEEV